MLRKVRFLWFLVLHDIFTVVPAVMVVTIHASGCDDSFKKHYSKYKTSNVKFAADSNSA